MKKVNKSLIRQEVNLLFSGLTIREIAKELDIKKSTVHYHLHHYVKVVCGPITANAVQSMLDHNFRQKHIRGGQANSKRWQEVRNGKAQITT